MRPSLPRWFLPLTFMLGALLLAAAPQGASAQTDQRCFPETGQCISGRIREYWEHNGGLPVFGFPTTNQHEELVEGKPFQVQWFQRNRLELHPENARPYDVLLGRLGVDRLVQQGRDWFTFPKGGEQNGCRHFAETGHTICGAFLNYFRTHGLDLSQPRITEAESLALFGLPVSEAANEVSTTDGKTYLTQHFERARLELHPENQPPYDVLLGLLGNEVRSGAAPPPPPPADPCADVPEPVSARIHPGKCIKAGTELSLDIFGFNSNEQVGFWLTSPDGSIIGTRGTYNIGPTGAVDGLTFPTNELSPGIYYWVFEGTSSKHQSIIYFKILAS